MSNAVNSYDYTTTANGSQKLDVTGLYVRMVSGTGLINIRTDYGGNVRLLAGQGYRFDKEFSWLEIRDRSGLANTGLLVIGDGGFEDDRITGEVSVIDGSKAQTLLNQAYSGYGFRVAQASQFSVVQLWNPATSLRRVLLKKINVAGGGVATAATFVQFSGSAAPNLLQTGIAKLRGGAASLMEIRADGAGSAPLLTGTFFGLIPPISNTLQFEFKEPIIFGPGFGVVLWSTQPNQDSGAGFEWIEESI